MTATDHLPAAINLPLQAETKVGFQERVGYNIIEWAQGHSCIELEIDALHLNRSNVVHGGVYATLLDAAMGFSTVYTGSSEVKNLVVTLSMTTNFIKGVAKGKIRAVGKMTGGGKTIAFAEGQIFDDEGVLLATASGTFKRVKF